MGLQLEGAPDGQGHHRRPDLADGGARRPRRRPRRRSTSTHAASAGTPGAPRGLLRAIAQRRVRAPGVPSARAAYSGNLKPALVATQVTPPSWPAHLSPSRTAATAASSRGGRRLPLPLTSRAWTPRRGG